MDLLQFDEELKDNDFWIYKKFDRDNKISTLLHQTGADLHITPSNDFFNEIRSLDGAISGLAFLL